MSVVKRPANEHGQTELGWLHGRHTFSFGEYYYANHMGFRSLRVTNDDIVDPGQGFGTQGHRDVEIFSCVIEGELEHKDSLGNGHVIKAGDLRYLSAGSGVRHSEFNPSPDKRVRFLQIWLLPTKAGGAPRYAEARLGSAAKPDALTPLFAGQHRVDAGFHFEKLTAGKSLSLPAGRRRGVWIHLIAGMIALVDEVLNTGDGAAVEGADEFEIKASCSAEFLAFGLA